MKPESAYLAVAAELTEHILQPWHSFRVVSGLTAFDSTSNHLSKRHSYLSADAGETAELGRSSVPAGAWLLRLLAFARCQPASVRVYRSVAAPIVQ